MVKEYGPDEQWKHNLRMILFILTPIIALMFIGYLTDNRDDDGPCSQYQTQEAFEACADSVTNGG